MNRPTYDWKLPPEIERRLGTETYGAQRAIFEAGHLLLVLHRPPEPGDPDRDAAVFLRQPDGRWLYQGQAPGEPAFEELLASYAGLQFELSLLCTRAPQLEVEELFNLQARALPLARAAANLKDTLQAARERVPEDRLVLTLRDRAVELSRGLELLLADSRLALDYRLARSAEEQARAALGFNRAQHKLNLIAALTFPLMALAAVFGMNLPSGLEQAPAWLFWAVFLAGLVLGLAVKGWMGRPSSAAAPAPAAGKGRRPGKSVRRPLK
ncbi:hypothetical protein OOT46_01670 [Aquabacterium sp. A7-Y]|uniref:CorA family divalent cation transporter n=1 Tax=Aquabacterium sp. A7-Y TaxID=1349605 RepID=UPI00223DA2BD|nr:CorA family divalent cation transporter [Aquabacterium sp. A7-Y]MCW7536564.1 hypothetical protein [Aquabacterium sp. A7-Y]